MADEYDEYDDDDMGLNEFELDELYELPTDMGTVRLSGGGPREKHRHLPPNSGNVMEDIYEDAVYGGDVDRNRPQHFRVYSVDIHQQRETARMNDVDAKPTQSFADSLNQAFSGWVYREDDGRIYVLDDDGEPDRTYDDLPPTDRDLNDTKNGNF